MVHSGSRNIGNKTAQYYDGKAKVCTPSPLVCAPLPWLVLPFTRLLSPLHCQVLR